jgi:hypothetical protein
MADTIHNPVPVEDVKPLYVRLLGFEDERMLSSFHSSRALTSNYTVGISMGAKYGYTHDLRVVVNEILKRILTCTLETPLQWRT